LLVIALSYPKKFMEYYIGSLLVIIGYVAFRVVNFSSWNVLNLTAVLIAGQALRSPESFRSTLPSLLFTAKIGIVADSLFAIEWTDVAALLSSLLCFIWIVVPHNNVYPPGKSNVMFLDTAETFEAFKITHKHFILLCCDFNALGSVFASHAFADLANGKIAEKSQWVIVDPVSTKLCKSLNLSTPLSPIVIRYSEGKEILRDSFLSLKVLKQKLYPIS
jgi:hypothetical protein